MRRRPFNRLKFDALSVLAEFGPLGPREMGVRVHLYPLRASYSYCSRLWRWGLLWREKDAAGRVTYRLSKKGWARLDWLASRDRRS